MPVFCELCFGRAWCAIEVGLNRVFFEKSFNPAFVLSMTLFHLQYAY